MTPLPLAVLVSVHVLAGVFWAGTTFAMARAGGQLAERLAQPQMGAAVFAVLAGAALFGLLHRGTPGSSEIVLGLGALAAVAAAGVQGSALGAVRRLQDGDGSAARRVALSQRLAAALLAITVVCMVTFRYA